MKRKLLGSTAVVCCIVGGCAVPVSFVIAGAAFTIGLELLEAFVVSAGGEPILQAAVIDLQFPSAPADRPGGASLNLDAQNIQAVPLDVAKVRTLQQSVNGQAMVDVLVGSAADSNPCSTGITAGQFTFNFDGTSVSVLQGSIDVPAQALDFVTSGRFTLCLGASANVDASITLDAIGVTFSSGQSGCPGGAGCPPEPTVCTNGFCQFGQQCDSSNRCVPIPCSSGACPLFLTCGNDGNCEPFDCVVDSTDVCALMGLTCSDGQCVPYPCTNNECPFGTGCNNFNQCIAIDCCIGTLQCGVERPCPGSLDCDPRGVCVEFTCTGDGDPFDCPESLRCEDGLCVPRTCATILDCVSGKEVCNAFGQCVPVQCINAQCPYGMQCDDFGQCLPQSCDQSPASCPIWTSCPLPPEPSVCVELPCDLDGSCERSSFRCLEGKCVPYNCNDDGTCPLGMSCNAFGECVPQSCVDSECPYGLNCYESRNLCLQFPCTFTACPSDLVCDETIKLCVAKECNADSDCPSGLVCTGGHCLAQPCGAGGACPTGTTCNAFGQCVPPPTCPAGGSKCEIGCTTDLDCSYGEFCVNGECGSSGGGDCIPGVDCEDECVTDLECPAGYYCNRHSVCVDPNTTECLDDGDCPLDTICNIHFLCEPIGGNCIPGVNCDTECDFDSDCPEGLRCSDPHCCYDPDLVECAFSSDCPDGKTCSCRYRCE